METVRRKPENSWTMSEQNSMYKSEEDETKFGGAINPQCRLVFDGKNGSIKEMLSQMQSGCCSIPIEINLTSSTYAMERVDTYCNIAQIDMCKLSQEI